MKFIGNVDLKQIECRVLNTLAGQDDVLEKFRNNVDIYSENATKFYGFPVTKTMEAERGTGKQIELSCGYQAGGATIVRTARAGTYGPPVYLSDAQGLAARDLYRDDHPFVRALWEKAAQHLWSLLEGYSIEWRPPGQTTPCLWIHDHRIFHAPSGLWIDYTSLERHVSRKDGQEYFQHKVREGWRKIYGGKLCQNVVELLAMQVIGDAIVRVGRNGLGYKIPLTVHDNIYVLIEANHTTHAEEQLELIRQTVAQPVPWLEACPIDADAELSDSLGKADAKPDNSKAAVAA